MHQKLPKILLCFFVAVMGLVSYVQAQTTVSGTILDGETKEPLIGVTVAIKGKVTGTITDNSGNFNLSTNTPPPFTLSISSVGYVAQELQISGSQSGISLELEVQSIMGTEIVVSGSRVEESILESAVSIEKMDILAIRNTASADFYAGLANMKGVDMSTQSLTFQSPNTRGFGANGNVRLLQLIDGMDSQAPGLNFSFGNIVGIAELDVESVELLPGASSVLYGPGAINGTLLMTSKSPFNYQGVSAYAKTGVMHLNADYRDDPRMMTDFGFRWAKSFGDKFAIKANASYLQALDWYAIDYRNRLTPNPPGGTGDVPTFRQDATYPDGTFPTNNPAYNGVNIYGGAVATNIGSVADALVGLGMLPAALRPLVPNEIVGRTGYRESDLVDYDTKSLKLNTSFHYRISEDVEAILQGNFGSGTSVYTGASRYSIQNFNFFQIKAEVKGSNFFLRAYTSQERSGDSYDATFTGIGINREWKSDTQWFGEYTGAFVTARATGQPVDAAHQFARQTADAGRFLPGSDGFNAAKDKVKNISIALGGSLFLDKTNMYHYEGMYNFNKVIDPAVLEIIVGAHYRTYDLKSEGTIFDDLDRELSIWEQGAYTQLTKKLFNDRLKLTASARYDKNQNFQARFTPRVGAVLSLGENKQHNIRLSYQSGFRNPTTQNQYINVVVAGVVRLIGGLPEFQTNFGLTNNAIVPDATGIGNYLTTLQTQGPAAAKANATYKYQEFKPEYVNSYEIGYKSLIANKLFIDMYAYYNQYNNFIGSVNVISGRSNLTVDPTGRTRADITTIQFSPTGVPNPSTYDVLSFPVNVNSTFNSFGWGFGFDYKLPGNFTLGGNVALNRLDKLPTDAPPGFQTQFNSPEYRTNVTFGNRNVYKNIGFNFAWRWQQGFRWDSGFANGDVPGYGVLDGQVSYKMSKIKTIFKIGASNLFNQYYTQALGNPSVGGLYYISVTFDQFLN